MSGAIRPLQYSEYTDFDLFVANKIHTAIPSISSATNVHIGSFFLYPVDFLEVRYVVFWSIDTETLNAFLCKDN